MAEPAPILRFDRIDSTMKEARRLADKGARGPLWITAGEQTDGRGRQARPWESGPGNLYATHLFAPECPPEIGALYSFVAALSVAAIADSALPSGKTRLKWPNDVLVEDKKISGILLESAGAARLSWLSIGIGVNLAHAPEETRWPAAALAGFGANLTPEQALSTLAAAFDRYARLLQREGFSPIREAWLARAARLGDIIEARTGRETLTGRFETIDEQGALVLDTGQGVRRIAAADIYF